MRDRRVDPVEYRRLARGGRGLVHPRQLTREARHAHTSALQPALPLRPVHRPARSRDLGRTAAGDRVVRTHVECERRRESARPGAAIELGRYPCAAIRRHGKTHRVACGLEAVAREQSTRLMMSMPVDAGPAPHRDHHLRAIRADHAHHVGGECLAIPLLEGLDGVLGEPEVVRAREELLRAVEPPCREQLLGADRAKALAEVVTDQVLAAVATREREVGHMHPVLACEPRQQLCVLVVRMRTDHEHAAGDGEPAQRLVQSGRAAFLPEGGTRRGDGQHEGGERDRATLHAHFTPVVRDSRACSWRACDVRWPAAPAAATPHPLCAPAPLHDPTSSLRRGSPAPTCRGSG